MKTSRTIRVTEVCSEETSGKVTRGSKQNKTHSIKIQINPKQQEKNYKAILHLYSTAYNKQDVIK